ncbi:MAG TPA: hypothetical protein VMT10_12115 [Solirubrobacteraceae bacterium]|nr:hypothetical protein [Solirubrobacteraceae bacterium]
MSTIIRRTVVSAFAAILAGALLAGPALARPAGFVPATARAKPAPVVIISRVAPPTSALSSYRNGFAADATSTSRPVAVSSPGSDTPWLGIGVALLGVALIGTGAVTLRRHRHQVRPGSPTLSA